MKRLFNMLFFLHWFCYW